MAWLEPVLRFLQYAVLLGLFGCTAFRLIGLRGLDLPSTDRCVVLIAIGVAAPLVSVALMLVSIAAMMGQPATALDWPMIEAMTVTTDMGWAFFARTALLVTALIALLARHRSAIAPRIAAACFAGALLTLGWSGHAAATEGALGLFHRLNNGMHLLAAGLWFGAIGWFLSLTVKTHRQPAHIPAQPLLAAMHRFAPLGVGLVATVTLTGLISAQIIFGWEHSGAVAATGYGMLLAVKMALVAAMLGFGAHNARVARHFAQTDDRILTNCDTVLIVMRRSLTREITLAILVIGLVAVLGMMSPMPM